MLKPGVRVLGVRPEMVLAFGIMRPIFERHGQPFVITSIVEGTHSRASLHYTGCAGDLRRPADATVAAQIVTECKSALGEDFDVILEIDHLHCEFQPKAPY